MMRNMSVIAPETDGRIDTVHHLIENAKGRLDSDPRKARQGLELAERTLDQMLAEKGMVAANPNNPFCWEYLDILNGHSHINERVRQIDSPSATPPATFQRQDSYVTK